MTRKITIPNQKRSKFPTEKLESLIDVIQARNGSMPEEEVLKDVTEAVEIVRQERYKGRFKPASENKIG